MPRPFRQLALAASMLMASPALAQTVERNPMPNGTGLILESVTIKPKATLTMVSGIVADPLDQARPDQGFGDTRAQAVSIFKKIAAALKRKGLSIRDVVRLTIYVVADPALGKPDFAGMNAVFREFFGTAQNPNTVARSAFAISGLQQPGLFLEIDAVAAR